MKPRPDCKDNGAPTIAASAAFTRLDLRPATQEKAYIKEMPKSWSEKALRHAIEIFTGNFVIFWQNRCSKHIISINFDILIILSTTLG